MKKFEAFLGRVERVLNSRLGNVFLILIYPLLVALAGLPLGFAEAALEAYYGRPFDLSAAAQVECPAQAPALPDAP